MPALVDYIPIPNKSPPFEPDLGKARAHGKGAADVGALGPVEGKTCAGATLSVERLPGRTPLILIDVPGAASDDTVLLYGHLDKQPEMTGWTEGKAYGSRNSPKATSSMAAAAPMMAMRCSGRSARVAWR